jgi:hypothetical protein
VKGLIEDAPDIVAHACKPSYSGGGDPKDHGL